MGCLEIDTLDGVVTYDMPNIHPAAVPDVYRGKYKVSAVCCDG